MYPYAAYSVHAHHACEHMGSPNFIYPTLVHLLCSFCTRARYSAACRSAWYCLHRNISNTFRSRRTQTLGAAALPCAPQRHQEAHAARRAALPPASQSHRSLHPLSPSTPQPQSPRARRCTARPQAINLARPRLIPVLGRGTGGTSTLPSIRGEGTAATAQTPQHAPPLSHASVRQRERTAGAAAVGFARQRHDMGVRARQRAKQQRATTGPVRASGKCTRHAWCPACDAPHS